MEKSPRLNSSAPANLQTPPSEFSEYGWTRVFNDPGILLSVKLDCGTYSETWDWAEIFGYKLSKNDAAIKIQRFYREHGAFPRWKRKIKETNDAILYSPKVKGIGFQEAEEDWNNRIS